MKSRNAFLSSGLLARAIITAAMAVSASMIAAPGASAQSSNKSQTVYLPDPTPRATDPHLLLKDNPEVGTSTQEAFEHRNQKRRELVVWAANELVVLSQRVQTGLTQPAAESKITPPNEAAISDAARAAAAANAERIEQLAKSLTAALKAP